MDVCVKCKSKMLQLEEIHGFAEVCRWLEAEHPISEVMHRLSTIDIDCLEQLGDYAQEKEVVAICGPLPSAGLAVIREFCALSRIRRHARDVVYSDE